MAEFGGRLTPTLKTAPLPVFSGIQELNCPHIHKYSAALERKFGKTLGKTFWKGEFTWW